MSNNYLISGSDKEILNLSLNKLIKTLGNFDIVKYDLNTSSFEDVLEDANMISLFSEKKIIVVFNTEIFKNSKDDDEEKVLEYLNNYNNDTYLIFLTESVSRKKKIFKYFEENNTYIENKEFNENEYCAEILKENKYKCSKNDINYLISKIGKNVNDIKNELDKLMIYKIDDKIINREDIDNICSNNFDDNIFNFTGAIIDNNVSKSIDLYYEFLEHGYDETMLIILLAGQFRTLYQVKKLANLGNSNEEITKILGFANPNRVKMCLKNAYTFTEKDLLHYISKLADMDYKVKAGLIDKKIIFELFLIKKDMD